ncbi:MAG: DinB family protein [Acidobacteriota bacterium]
MTRTPQEISRLFAYGRWANGKMLDSVAGLTAEEFRRPVGGSFGSIHGTLAHVYGADWIWLERWHGRSPRALPSPDEVPTFETLREKWTEVQDRQRSFVEALTPERLAEGLSYANFKGETWTYPLGEALLHVVNHGTYHRGQVTTLLRQLGKPAVSTDYLRYIDAGAPP